MRLTAIRIHAMKAAMMSCTTSSIRSMRISTIRPLLVSIHSCIDLCLKFKGVTQSVFESFGIPTSLLNSNTPMSN